MTSEFSFTGYGNPRWSPDYKWMTYGGNVGPGNNFLHIIAPTGGVPFHIVNDVSTRRARYSADGKHIAFECSDMLTTTYIDVCTVTGVDVPAENMGDGAGKIVVTASVFGQPFSPTAFAWNPLVADQLAVVRNDILVSLTTFFYTMNRDGSGAVQIGNLPDGVTIRGTMDWSPDQTLLAFGASDGKLYTMAVATGTLGALTTGNPTRADQNPVFSPDGSTLLFFGDVGCQIEWHTVLTTGGSEAQLTDELNGSACEDAGSDGGPFAADWSPDGTMIVLSQIDGVTFDGVVYIVPRTITAATYPEQAVLVRGTDGGLRDIQPGWRP